MKRSKIVKSVSIARERSTSTKRSRDTARRKRRPKPGTKGAQHPDHHHASARWVRVDQRNAPAVNHRDGAGPSKGGGSIELVTEQGPVAVS